MPNEVKWIKITTDVFDNWKIKQLKAIPELGHTMICIWFELLCMAGICNEHGLIVLSNRFVATDEIIANTFGEDVKIVKMALETFEKLGMIEITDNDAIQITNWLEYQNGDRLNEIKQSNKERQQRYRDKQKALQITGEDARNVTRNVTNNVTPSLSYSDSNSNSISDSISDSVKEIIDYLNIKCNKHYTYKNKSNISHIKARLSEGFTVDDFKTVIDNKANAWLDDPKMCDYLRPETLFCGRFESYLNEQAVKPKQKSSVEGWLDVGRRIAEGEY